MQAQSRQTPSSEARRLLTFEGFSLLMIVVLPLLSKPRHKTWTSFFFRPSHPASLSNNPMAVDEVTGTTGCSGNQSSWKSATCRAVLAPRAGMGPSSLAPAAMVGAGPRTNTAQGLALHISTWRVSWLQPGYQSSLAVYSPVCVTLCPWFTGQKNLSSPNEGTKQCHLGSHLSEQNQKEGHDLYLKLSAVHHSDNKTVFPFISTCYVTNWTLH